MVGETFFLRIGMTHGAQCHKCGVAVEKGRYKVASETNREGVSLKSGEDFVSAGKPYYVGYWCIECMRAGSLLW